MYHAVLISSLLFLLLYFQLRMCTEILQYKETQAEATKLENESISFIDRGLNTLQHFMYENEHKLSIVTAAYLVDLSSSLVPTMTESLRPLVLMLLFLCICWICMEDPVPPPAGPVLGELQHAICTPHSRIATRA